MAKLPPDSVKGRDRMIPVQVGTRIVDLVDPARAASMENGQNVIAVRARKTKSIVRIIVINHALGNGHADEPSDHEDSRKSTFVEHLSSGRTLYQLKRSQTFGEVSRSSPLNPVLGKKRAGQGRVPTTTATTARSGSKPPCR